MSDDLVERHDERAAPPPSARPKPEEPGRIRFAQMILAALAIFFVATTYAHLLTIESSIKTSSSIDLAFLEPGKLPPDVLEQGGLSYWQVVAILESNSLEARYHQANMILSTRVWIRYLGFLTGMILCFVGASFILARLSEKPIALSGEGSTPTQTAFKLAVNTSSPGLYAISAGTLLIIIAMVVNPAVIVNDRPIYLQSGEAGLAGATPPQPTVQQ